MGRMIIQKSQGKMEQQEASASWRGEKIKVSSRYADIYMYMYRGFCLFSGGGHAAAGH
jgi:hypothetical protein